MRMFTSLVKASAVAALVFALAWIRQPLPASTLVSTVRLFIGFGCVFAILSLLIGLPFVLIIEKCRIGAWWSNTIVAAVTGALLALSFGHRTEQAAQLRTFVSYTLPTPIRVLRNVILSEVESSMPL
jgi:hypothetical protein